MATQTSVSVDPMVSSLEADQMKWFFGGKTWLRATADSTSGAYGMIEQVGAPGIGSPYHVHHNEDESFYVIEGSVRFVSGDQSWIGGPGSLVFLPRDVPHGFEVYGETEARFLLWTNPGGFEAFVQEFWEDAPAPPDMEKIMEAAARYGLEILGPLPE